MFLSPLQLQVLESLRHGELDQFQIGADLDEAPFKIRAELRHLRGQRLVREELSRRRHVWALTDRGWEIVLEGDQMELGA